jgi:PEP-CTERM motif
MKSVTLSSLGLALALSVTSPFVCGNILTPGTGGAPDPISSATWCTGDACTIEALTTGTYTVKDASGTTTQTGLYDAAVVIDSTSLDLDFVYEFQVTDGTSPFIASLSASAFGGFTTDVDYDSGDVFSNLIPVGTIINPNNADRSPGAGDVIDYDFNPGDVTKGNTSAILIIRTNAQYWQAGSFALQDDNNSGNIAAYAPAAVPEPTSILLFGGALALACRAIRRKLHSA